MQMTSKLTITIIISFSLLIAFVIFKSLFVNENLEIGNTNSKSVADFAVSPQDLTGIQNQYDSLRSRYEEIQRQQQLLNDNLTKLSQTVNESSKMLTLLMDQGNNDPSSGKPAELSSPTAQIQQQAADPVLEEQKSKREVSDRLNQLELAIQQQDTDPSWSDFANEQIATVVSSGDFSGSNVITSDCRSSFCSLDVQHEDQESMEKFMNTFSAKLGWNNSAGQFQIIEQGDQYVTRLYVSRSDYSLPEQ